VKDQRYLKRYTYIYYSLVTDSMDYVRIKLPYEVKSSLTLIECCS